MRPVSRVGTKLSYQLCR